MKNESLYTNKIKNIRNSWILLSVMGGFIIAVGYLLSYYLDSPGILVVAFLASVVTSFGTYWFSDKYVLATTHTKLIDRSSNKKLYDIIDNVAIAAGIPTPKIGIIEDDAPNAFATGRDPNHSVVVFTTGLLHTLNDEEIKGVAAHEISHIINRDMLIGTIAVIFAGVISFIARIFSNVYSTGSRNSKNNNVISLIITLFLIFLAPIIATLLRMAISRKREFLADTTGAYIIGNPENLASALEKISSYSRPMRSASESTAHLFIANPLDRDSSDAHSKKFLGKLGEIFSTHPPIEERIARLRGMDKYGDI